MAKYFSQPLFIIRTLICAIGAYEGYKIAERKGLEGSDKIWTIIGGGLIGGIAGGLSSYVGISVGAAMSVGGFIGGATAGAAAGATGGFINGFGMSTLETGDLSYGFKQGVVQAVIGAGAGAIIGGTIGGISSAIKGNNFWNGGEIPTNPNIIEEEYFTRPQNNGYDIRLEGQTDTYRNFPYSFDEYIINNGAAAQRIKDGAFWFELKESINGVEGMYQIGINQDGIIFHRAFIPL